MANRGEGASGSEEFSIVSRIRYIQSSSAFKQYIYASSAFKLVEENFLFRRERIVMLKDVHMQDAAHLKREGGRLSLGQRQRFLERIDEMWVQGVLEPSLEGRERLALTWQRWSRDQQGESAEGSGYIFRNRLLQRYFDDKRS